MDRDETRLVEDHIHLAEYIANSIYNTATHALEKEELRSVAYMALVKAALRWRGYCVENNYNPDDTQYFKTVAYRTIRGAIYDDLRVKDWASRTIRTRSKAIREAGMEQTDSVEDIAKATGMSEKAVRSTLWGMNCKPVSIETVSDFDADETMESILFADTILKSLSDKYASLPFDQQVVIALKYFRGKSLKAIADEVGYPSALVSELHSIAVVDLFESMSSVAKDDVNAV